MRARDIGLIAFLIVLKSPIVVADDQPAKDKDLAKKLEVVSRDLKSPVPAQRVRGVEAIAKMGKDGAGATRLLCAALVDRHHTVRQAASEALEKVNPDFREIVFPIVVEDDAAPRLASLNKLRDAGEKASAAFPVVLFRLRTLQSSKRDSARESSACLETLFAIAKDDKAVSEVIFSLASNTEARHSLLHRQALGYLPNIEIDDSKRVVNMLTDLVKNDSDENKPIAMNQLAKYGRKAKSAIEILRKSKASPSAEVRQAAAAALSTIEEDVAAARKSVERKP